MWDKYSLFTDGPYYIGLPIAIFAMRVDCRFIPGSLTRYNTQFDGQVVSRRAV